MFHKVLSTRFECHSFKKFTVNRCVSSSWCLVLPQLVLFWEQSWDSYPKWSLGGSVQPLSSWKAASFSICFALGLQGSMFTSTLSKNSSSSRLFPGPLTSVEAPRSGQQAHYLVMSEVVRAGTRRSERCLKCTLPRALHLPHPPTSLWGWARPRPHFLALLIYLKWKKHGYKKPLILKIWHSNEQKYKRLHI